MVLGLLVIVVPKNMISKKKGKLDGIDVTVAIMIYALTVLKRNGASSKIKDMPFIVTRSIEWNISLKIHMMKAKLDVINVNKLL